MITRIANGMYCVEHDGRNEIIYVAGPLADRWVFWNGQVFRRDFRANGGQTPADAATGPEAGAGPHKVRPTSLAAPMPARVSRILVKPGAAVRKGDTLIALEAMKMELPLRAQADGVVAAIHCREGELVDADAILIDLE